MSKEQKIKQMLAMGKTPAEIAKALKTSRQYVYTVKSKQYKNERKAIANSVRQQATEAPLPWWKRFVNLFKGN
jgi:DNA-binding CsgD family transcriptional regulator